MTSPYGPDRTLVAPPTNNNFTTPALATYAGGNSTVLLQQCCASTSPGAIVQYDDQLQYCTITDCSTALACIKAAAPGLTTGCFKAAALTPGSVASPRTTINSKAIVAVGVLALAYALLN